MTTRLVAAAALAFCSLAVAQTPATAPEAPAVLLERGLYTEQTVGDLDAAIRIYQQVVERARADRPLVAQAYLRLANCQLKKGERQQAIATLRELVSQFPDQKYAVAQAEKGIAQARQDMTDAEVARIVGEVVTDISTRSESDLQMPKLLATLRELKEPTVIKELARQLDSDKATVRRSAIYALWMGGFSDASAAAPALLKLCSHEEEFTRGMAAIALGRMKADAAFDKLANMAVEDKSGYARRCAVYALGLTGQPKARPIVEKALKDEDPLVRNNAESAMTMLNKAAGGGRPAVVSTSPKTLANDVDPALDKIAATFDQEMMDRSWSWTNRDKETFPKTTGDPAYDAARRTCSLPVKLEPGKVYWVGANHANFTNFQSAAHLPARPYVILFATKSAEGKPTSLPEELVKQAKAINEAAASQPEAGLSPAERQAAVDSAKSAAEEWLRLLDAGKYGEGWSLAHGMLRKALTNEAWAAAMKAAREPLGKAASRKLISAHYATSLPGAPDGQYVVIQFATSFENKKEAVETITPSKDTDGKWRVSGYYIK